MDGDVEDGSSTTGRPESEEESQVRKRVRVDEGAAAASASTDIDVSNLRYDPDNQNRFGLFADLQIENVEVDNSSNIQIAPRSQRVEPAKKKSFCPPIFLHNVNIKRLVQQLEAKSPKIDFKIKNVSKTKSKLYFSDVNVHTTMMALLRERGVHSYSYTPKDLKQMSLVLRGLYHGQDVEDVKVALDSAIPGAVSRVAKFTTPHSLKNKTDTGLFLINLVPGKGLNDVQHIRYLLSQTITWEIPKKKEQEIQCHRCQRWGHVSRNCNSEFKCVKCDISHSPGECQRQKTETSAPHCVNCNISGHTANWKGCPMYKRYLLRKEQLKKARELKETAKTNANRAHSSCLRSPGKSYASHFKFNETPNHQKSKPSVVDEFLKLANYFLEPEELSLEQEINIFLADFQSMSKADAKIEFVRLLKKVKNTYGP